jgi:hypothetical protein
MSHRGWSREFHSQFCLRPHTWLLYLSIGQDRIEITSENMLSWLVDSPIVKGLTHYDSGRVTGGLNEKLELQLGDVVWIGTQRDRPEVKAFVYSFPA